MKLFRQKILMPSNMNDVSKALADAEAKMPKKIVEAHGHCSQHKQEIMASKLCGCFYCLNIYPPTMVQEWIDKDDSTALCPKCGIDAVIGDASGYSVEKSFLKKMKRYWFNA